MDRAQRGNLLAHGLVMMTVAMLSGVTTTFAAAPHAALRAHRLGVVGSLTFLALAGVWPHLGESAGNLFDLVIPASLMLLVSMRRAAGRTEAV